MKWITLAALLLSLVSSTAFPELKKRYILIGGKAPLKKDAAVSYIRKQSGANVEIVETTEEKAKELAIEVDAELLEDVQAKAN